MHVTDFAVSLNVPDPQASARFLHDHLGHTTTAEADGFVAVRHPSGGPGIAFLRTGLESFRPAHRAGSAGEGLLLAFVVESVDDTHATLVENGAPVVTPPETEPWGERYSQYEDPNGIIVQLVEWVQEPPPA
ncbi:MAG: VOC family protein [Phycicoccus sp.]